MKYPETESAADTENSPPKGKSHQDEVFGIRWSPGSLAEEVGRHLSITERVRQNEAKSSEKTQKLRIKAGLRRLNLINII